jgi:hypothetical protein
MRRLYFRCLNGHYITEGYCPIDGWTNDQISNAVALFAQKPEMTIEDLIKAGVGVDLASRMLIIETLAPHSVEFTTVNVLKSMEENS